MAGNGGPSFAQQGSVDWVALSNSSVQFSVAVLARLARAGNDAFTLQFGRAICYRFSLEPRAQERIHDAMVVTDLADTEEGLTLVALCAALATTYDSMYAAIVIRELCVLCKAPQSFTPAVRQWRALVDLCSGIFVNAHFALLANGFRRLLSGHSDHLIGRHTPTTHSALAEAILMLAKISKGDILNATFSGGIDCAWLAAFAESILSLDVAFCHPSGLFLYRSRGATDKPPQVTIVVPTNGIQEVLIKSKASFIPSGKTLFGTDPSPCGVNLLNWQASWSTILHEVFYGDIDDLLSEGTGQFFSMYIYCVSLLPASEIATGPEVARYARTSQPSFLNHPVNPLIWTQADSRGQAFIKFAARRLPEIAACLMNATWDASASSVDDLGLLAIRSIESVCSCASHLRNNQEKVRGKDPFCLRTMAETIAIFLWILLDSDIDEDVLPSITGLANLYTWQSRTMEPREEFELRRTFGGPIMNCSLPVLGIDLVFHVLSGLAIPDFHRRHKSLPPTDHLARVGNGVCVYHYAVEDPNLPPETMFRLRVVRGYISYSGLRFKEICGFKDANVDSSLKLCELRGRPSISSVQPIVQETEDETRLEMAYLVHYCDKGAQLATHWLHLPYIFRHLKRRIISLNCAGNCPALYDVESSNDDDFLDIVESSPLLARKENYDRTQQMISGLRHAGDSWTLLSDPSLFTIITGQPILLYALINEFTRTMHPFKDCLNCIIRAGGHFYIHYHTEQVDISGTQCSSTISV